MEGVLITPLKVWYDLELPPGHSRRKRWPLLIGTHGYEGNKESMMKLVTAVAGGRMIAASLQGPYQFFLGRDGNAQSARVGFGWGTSYRGLDSVALHHHAMNALIETAVEAHRADPARVFLMAFSQSCSYNYRFAFSHPAKVRGVIAVCGGIPGDWKENPRYHCRAAHVLHIAASDDRWYSRERNEQFRRDLPLRAASVDFRVYQGPHKFPRAAVPHIRRWIEDKLEGS
jgi:predicted esterase